MAKHLNFVVEMEGDTHPVAWPPHFYEAASNATGLRFVLGTNDAHKPGLPPAIENHGLLPQPLFLDTISRSRILIGVGSPLAYVISSKWKYYLFVNRCLFTADHQHHMMHYV
jgi:hypothetical protein